MLRYKSIQIFSLPLLLFPIRKNKIVVDSFFGKGYGDNPKYIVDELLNYDNVEIVWIVKNIDNRMPSQIRQVKKNSAKALYELATAKIWIDNSRKDFVPFKRRGQFYLQTWHGPLALKYIEKDALPYLSKYYEMIAINDSRNCDLMITGSTFGRNLIANSFWYDGEIQILGTPRCDRLVKLEKSGINLQKELGIPESSLLILYAPTFRKNRAVNLDDLDIMGVLKSFEKKFGKNSYLMVRLHPIDSTKIIIENDINVINVSDYPDMQILIEQSDIVITDYSSSMFDALIGKKACFLLATDIEDYLKYDRPMYFNMNDLPFSLSRNSYDLIKNIEKFNYSKYISEINKFSEKIGINEDGYASEKVALRLKKILEAD